VPIPLPDWEDRDDKRLYVWFDAVIGYLSASIEWARRSGDPDAWRQFWQNPDAASFYFMGKDNVVFHSVIWPAILLGASGRPEGAPGVYGELDLPSEVVSSEYLTMEGRKFSSSRSVVIYVRDVLERYGPDALRYYLAAAGPESSDTDFTWEQFVTRNNTELVAGWGNLVNRTLSLVAKNVGAIPAAGELTAEDAVVLNASRAAFDVIGDLLGRNQQKAALHEAMRVVSEANKYLSDTAPWKLKDEPDRRASVLHVALQLIDDAKTLLTPFLPHSSQRVYELLGGQGAWSGLPELREVDDLDGGPSYPVLTGDYAAAAAVWESLPITPGVVIATPTPLFTKLDPSVVEEELARLEGV
jgi:methionyl-tRNA synthetase